MHDFDFIEPATVEEAGGLLAQLDDDGRAFAGGTALLLAMRQRMLAPTTLVSLGRIERLRGIDLDSEGRLRIGAMTRHSEIARSALVRTHAPLLASVAGELANPQIRNQGTIGGNLCYGDPSTDPPSCLIALGAELAIGGVNGERRLPVEDFMVDYFVTALEPGELLLEVIVPPAPADGLARYARHRRTAAEHRPLVNLALAVRHDNRRCSEARLVVGACVPIAGRLPRAEALLCSRPVDLALAGEVAERVAEDIEAVSDSKTTDDYRRTITRVIARRTICEAFGLTQGASA